MKREIILTVLLLAAVSAAGLVLAAQPARAVTAPASASAPSAPPGATIAPEGWFAPPQRSAPLPVLPKEVSRAFVIPIREAITSKTYEAVRRKVIRCRKSGAEMVIFDMDTPGGEGEAMLGIVRLIADGLNDTYTVAYVNPEAVSAGAIISLACDEIVMGPTGVIGDAMPINVGPGGFIPIPREERGKLESYIKGQIRSVIQQKGHNEAICEAMVTLSMEIWLVRDRRTGELQIVDAAKWRGKVHGAPPTTQPVAAAPVAPDSPWEYIRLIDGPDSLVTMTANEALNLGFTRYVFSSLEDLERHYHVVGEPTVLDDNWSETLVEFLTSAPIAAFLMFVGIICVYVEMNHPGLIVPAAIAAVCFGILFGSRYLVGMAQWWHIALFLVGIILILVEVFLTPTFGILGVVGIIFCIVGLLALVVPTGPGKWPIPKTDLDWSVFQNGAFAMGVGFVAAIIAAGILAKHLPKVPLASRLILAPVQAPTDAPVADSSAFRLVQVGDVGVAETVCRPVGKVRFGEALLDASSEGGVVEAGSRVRVLQRDANRLIVEKVEDA